MRYLLQIREYDVVRYAGELEAPLEIGRQQLAEALLEPQTTAEGTRRLTVAPVEETRIGRRQLALQPQAEDRVRLENLSPKVCLNVAGGGRLGPGAALIVNLPVTVQLPGARTITISPAYPTESLQSLAEATAAPGMSGQSLAGLSLARPGWGSGQATESLIQALQRILDVYQSARNPQELFDLAIRGARELADFDRAQVLMFADGEWIAAPSSLPPQGTWQISHTVLARVHEQRRTFWELDHDSQNTALSLAGVSTVIAAPILSPEGRLIGTLYCDRRNRSAGLGDPGVNRLDARLIELLAGGVASGLARMEQAEAAHRLHSQFEQFFSPELARELDSNPDLLEGRDADVSILFCDIRGFSRISERIGVRPTFEWIFDVMSTLSECVTRHQGVVVDYIGDELMAMWGAPRREQNHARLACRAALEMQGQLVSLNSRWQPLLGEAMDFGVGINSGPVRAGNAGSRRKFKYSPLGNTVNLASRVQGACRFLKSRTLIAEQTAEQLDDEFLLRKLAGVRLVNISQAVNLYELAANSSPEQAALYEQYRHALTAFEQRRFQEAARQLSKTLEVWPDDGPSLALLKRAVIALVDGPRGDHPLWTLDEK